MVNGTLRPERVLLQNLSCIIELSTRFVPIELLLLSIEFDGTLILPLLSSLLRWSTFLVKRKEAAD